MFRWDGLTWCNKSDLYLVLTSWFCYERGLSKSLMSSFCSTSALFSIIVISTNIVWTVNFSEVFVANISAFFSSFTRSLISLPSNKTGYPYFYLIHSSNHLPNFTYLSFPFPWVTKWWWKALFSLSLVHHGALFWLCLPLFILMEHLYQFQLNHFWSPIFLNFPQSARLKD